MKLPLNILSTAILAFISLNAMSAEKLKPDEKTSVAKTGIEESINSVGLKIRIFKDASLEWMNFLTGDKVETQIVDKFSRSGIIFLINSKTGRHI